MAHADLSFHIDQIEVIEKEAMEQQEGNEFIYHLGHPGAINAGTNQHVHSALQFKGEFNGG